MRELPSGWADTSVGEVSQEISYGYTASASQVPNGPKFLRITDIQNGIVDWPKVPFCKIRSDQLSRYTLTKGDIVFARTGATTGKSFLITSCPPETIFASYLIRVRPADCILPELMAYFFQSPGYWQQITENISGSAQPNCNASKLSSLRMPIPPLNEQRRIVAKLEKLLSRVDAAQARLAKIPLILQRFRKAILAAATSGKLTEDWRRINQNDGGQLAVLGTLGKVVAGQSPSKSEVNYEGRGELYVTGPEQWTDRGIVTNKWTEHPKRIAPENSIFVTVKGAGVGTTFPGRKAAIGRDIYAFVPNREHEFKYVLYVIQASVADIITKAKGLIPGLSKSDLTDHQICLHSIPEQQEIVRRVGALFKTADALETRYMRAKDNIDRLRSSILDVAFRGELGPQNPNEEPASVLLEKIHGVAPTKPKRNIQIERITG